MNDDRLVRIFFEIHRDNPREGPGDFESTRQALGMLKNLPAEPFILDVGCGPGQQTLDLAGLTNGTICAMDLHKIYLHQLKRRISKQKLTGRILPLTCNMTSMAFCGETFDIIWAEGSIYLMGFQTGLTSWKPFLKQGGYLVVSEATWLREDAPAELQNFWREGYPGMATITGNIKSIESCGYQLLGYFVLPESAWWNQYYTAIGNKIKKMKQKYPDDRQVAQVIKTEQFEMDLYRRYSSYYGYVFYMMQKP